MICKKCGTELKEDSLICDACGTKVEPKKPNFQYEIPSNFDLIENNSNDKKVTMGIAVGIILLIAGAIAFVVFNRCEECPSCENNNNINLNTTTNKIKLSGYDVILSDNYKYSIEGNTMYISNNNDKWGASLYMIDGTYEMLLSKQAKMKETMQLDGYTLSLVEERTINNNKFLVIEATKMNTSVLFALTKVINEDVGVCVLEIYNVNNTFDYTVLNALAPTLNNIKYNNPPLTVMIKDYDLSRFSLFSK